MLHSPARVSLATLALGIVVAPASAAVINFETEGQYAANFRFVEDEGNGPRRDVQSSNGAANDYLRVTGATGASRHVSVYDTTPASNAARDSFGSGLTVEFDARIAAAQQSVGIFLINAAAANEDAAYLALFNVDQTGTTDRVRFSSNGNPPGGQAGTLGNQFDGDAGYNASLTDWVHFTLNYTIDASNQPVLAFTVGSLPTQTVTFTTAAFENVEVALRISPSTVTTAGANFVDIDNFSIVVPEPASLALLGAGIVAVLGGRRRREA